jgi:hypothetical protein
MTALVETVGTVVVGSAITRSSQVRASDTLDARRRRGA